MRLEGGVEGGASRGAVSVGGGDDGCRRPPQADVNFTSLSDSTTGK